MDLQGLSFCAENKKKIKLNPFSFLTTAIKQSRNMANHFSDTQLAEQKMEVHCLPHIFEVKELNYNSLYPDNVHNFSCQGNLSKDGQFPSGKTMFEQCNNFPAISFSKLVGGFVGSKSQVCSANREPCQIWDIIIRELAKSTCHSLVVNNSARECFDFGKSVSHNIFGSFCQTRTAFDIASYLELFENTAMFQTQPKQNSKVFLQSPSAKERMAPRRETHYTPLPLGRETSFLPLSVELKSDPPTMSRGPKQSYADVAKSFPVPKSNVTNSQRGLRRTNSKDTASQGKKMSINREQREFLSIQRRQSIDHSNWRDETEPFGHHYPTSRHYVSRHRNRNFEDQQNLLFKKQEQEEYTSKPGSDRFERVWSRCGPEVNYVGTKTGSRDYRKSISAVEHKTEVLAHERKSRNGYRDVESRIQKRVDVNKNCIRDQGICKFSMKPETACKNWRCLHNRTQHSDYRGVSRKSAHILSRPISNDRNSWRSLPAAGVCESRISTANPTEPVQIAREFSCNKLSPIGKDSQQSPGRERTLSESSNSQCPSLARELSSSMESGSFTSSTSSASNGVVSRRRYPSECESEDSFVVTFEADYGRCGSPDPSEVGSLSECDTSDLDSDQESDIGDEYGDGEDELDFCHNSPGDIHQWDDNVSSQMSSKARLKDINSKWQQECSSLPSAEKTPEKVQFAGKGALTKVYPMIKWDYAYRTARCGPWEEMARDRTRFLERIKRTESVLATVLSPQHRSKVWRERMSDD